MGYFESVFVPDAKEESRSAIPYQEYYLLIPKAMFKLKFVQDQSRQ